MRRSTGAPCWGAEHARLVRGAWLGALARLKQRAIATGRVPDQDDLCQALPAQARHLVQEAEWTGVEAEIRVGLVLQALGLGPVCDPRLDADGVDWRLRDGRAVQVYAGGSQEQAAGKRNRFECRHGADAVFVWVRSYGGGPFERSQLLDILEPLGAADRTYEIRHLLPYPSGTVRDGKGVRAERLRRVEVHLPVIREQDGTLAVFPERQVPAGLEVIRWTWVGIAHYRRIAAQLSYLGLPALAAPTRVYQNPDAWFWWTEVGWKRFGQPAYELAARDLGQARVRRLACDGDPGRVVAWDRWQVLAVRSRRGA